MMMMLLLILRPVARRSEDGDELRIRSSLEELGEKTYLWIFVELL